MLAVSLWLVQPSAPALAGCEFGVRTDTPAIDARARGLTLSPDQVAQRTDFLIESLESRQRYATRWHRLWVAAYSIGLVVGATRAGVADGDGARAEHLVTATKALIGLVQIYGRPVCDRFGADPILKMPDGTDEDRLRRLVAAEDLLSDNAKVDDSRWSWLPHVFNAALNLAGGGVLLAIDEPERAGMSSSVGLAFGELYIWTQPKGAEQDWKAYRRRFGDESEFQWSFSVMPGGLAMEYRF